MAATAGKSPITPAVATAPEQPYLTPQRIRILGIGGAVVLVIALAIWFTITAGQRKQAYAATALEQCRDAAAQANFGVAVQCYTQLARNFSGTPSAYEATLGVAQTHLVAGQNELAITGLVEFLRSNPPPEAASPANSLLGTAYENVGKFAEAEGAYRKASDLATVEYLKASALLDAGRAALGAKKVDDAKAIYNEIITKYAKSGAMTEAQVRLAEISAKPT